ncbi:MAG: alpha/beta hydrolase [Gammaproteobacteria bacterium]|nr:alpha/beta hydrolase [Gammaproteobacteria bacterium]
MEINSLLLDKKFQLTWNEYGTPDGKPVFYFHGAPGSRLEAFSADSIARELDIRLIAPDRPGFGDSDPQNNFRLLDWPDAIAQLANHLNLKQFSILAFSGGGPYALACAHAMPERIDQLTLVSSIAPFNTEAMQNYVNAAYKPLYELAAADYSAALQQISQIASTPEDLLDVIKAPAPSFDLALFDQQDFHAHYLNNLSLTIHNGIDGIANDLRNFALPWGFDPTNIQLKINIWHGQNDHHVGFPIGEYLSNSLKNTATSFIHDAGHYFLFEHWQEILQQINPGTQ